MKILFSTLKWTNIFILLLILWEISTLSVTSKASLSSNSIKLSVSSSEEYSAGGTLNNLKTNICGKCCETNSYVWVCMSLNFLYECQRNSMARRGVAAATATRTEQLLAVGGVRTYICRRCTQFLAQSFAFKQGYILIYWQSFPAFFRYCARRARLPYTFHYIHYIFYAVLKRELRTHLTDDAHRMSTVVLNKQFSKQH